ncbi:hypothetical protein K439DRAFT_1640096 [Ramaria rubella]|nr:hypothetical protein K439DRAFT_1640096 [Ramaria rubella]
MIQEQADIQASKYVLVAGFTLIVYDTILSLRHEIQFIWKEKFRIAATFYVIARYPMIFYMLVGVITIDKDLAPQYDCFIPFITYVRYEP